MFACRSTRSRRAPQPIAHRRPCDSQRWLFHQHHVTPSGVELAQVGVEVVRVACRGVGRGNPHEFVDQRLTCVAREHGDALALAREAAREFVDQVAFDQHHRGARRVVFFECAGGTWRGHAWRGQRCVERGFDLRGGDDAGAQQRGLVAGYIDDGGFDADVAGAAVENAIHRVAKFLPHVFGGGGGYAPEAIGGGADHAPSEALQ